MSSDEEWSTGELEEEEEEDDDDEECSPSSGVSSDHSATRLFHIVGKWRSMGNLSRYPNKR